MGILAEGYASKIGPLGRVRRYFVLSESKLEWKTTSDADPRGRVGLTASAKVAAAGDTSIIFECSDMTLRITFADGSTRGKWLAALKEAIPRAPSSPAGDDFDGDDAPDSAKPGGADEGDGNGGAPTDNLDSLHDLLESSNVTQRMVSYGPTFYLYVADESIKTLPLISAFSDLKAKNLFPQYTMMHFLHDDEDNDSQDVGIAAKIAHGVGCTAKAAAIIIQGGDKYIYPADGATEPLSAPLLRNFASDFKAGRLTPYVKSAPRTKDDLEPFIPGCHRLTATNWKEVVAAPKETNIFLQEFADWCPYWWAALRRANNANPMSAFPQDPSSDLWSLCLPLP